MTTHWAMSIPEGHIEGWDILTYNLNSLIQSSQQSRCLKTPVPTWCWGRDGACDALTRPQTGDARVCPRPADWPARARSSAGRAHSVGSRCPQWHGWPRGAMAGALGAGWLFPLQELVTVHRWDSTQPPLVAWALFPACVSPP